MLLPWDQLIHKAEGEQGNFIEVIRDNCTACKKCIIVCSVNLWFMDKGKANIKDNYKNICLECASCWQACDFNAIKFRYPNGGTGVIFKRG